MVVDRCSALKRSGIHAGEIEPGKSVRRSWDAQVSLRRARISGNWTRNTLSQWFAGKKPAARAYSPSLTSCSSRTRVLPSAGSRVQVTSVGG
jgi:hypothetical protein